MLSHTFPVSSPVLAAGVSAVLHVDICGVRSTPSLDAIRAHLFAVEEPPALQGSDDPAVAITDALIGPPQIRPAGWEPTDANRDSIRETVERHIALGTPIDCLAITGAVKHFGTSPRPDADLAELFMLLRYLGLQRAVQTLYPPGLSVRVVLQDHAGRFLRTRVPDVEERMSRYRADLETLAAILGLRFLSIVAESEILEASTVPINVREQFALGDHPPGWELFRTLAERLSVLFDQYLSDSDAHFAEGNGAAVSSLVSAAALRAIGFRGDIPPVQREYYYRRASHCSAAPLSPEEVRRDVARYLGYSMARGRLGLDAALSTDALGSIPPLKLSFVPYPPGAPTSVQRNRLEYVAVRRTRGSKRKVAPWGGVGAVRVDTNRLTSTILTPRESLAAARVAHGSLDLRGEGGNSIVLPCDLIAQSADN